MTESIRAALRENENFRKSCLHDFLRMNNLGSLINLGKPYIDKFFEQNPDMLEIFEQYYEQQLTEGVPPLDFTEGGRVWDKVYDEGINYQSDDFKSRLPDILEFYGIDDGVVVDVGAGKNAVTSGLDVDKYFVVELDRSCTEQELGNVLRLRFDIEDIYLNQDSTRSAIAKCQDFVGICPEDNCGVDVFVFSRILNYVDCVALLDSVTAYLKKGGVMVFNEEVQGGFTALFHEKGLTAIGGPMAVIDYLGGSGFESHYIPAAFEGPSSAMSPYFIVRKID